jgi:PAS domain S-box-containing protein
MSFGLMIQQKDPKAFHYRTPGASGEPTGSARNSGKYLVRTAIVACAYFAAGRLGLSAPFTSGNVSPVWLASGIALAAVLSWGYGVWPGIAAGAFLVNFFSPIPHLASVGLAAGNTLAALTGAFLLRQIPDFEVSLSRLRDVLGFIISGALGSSMVSASVGVAILFATHVHAWSAVGSAWLVYWLGDAMGVLLVAPFVLTLPHWLRLRPRVRLAELGILLLLLTATSLTIFNLRAFTLAVFPFVVWAAIRFGVSGCSLSTLIIAAVGITQTAHGSGPFVERTPLINAGLLQLYLAVLSGSGLLVAALIAERDELIAGKAAKEAERQLAAIVEGSEDAIISKDMNGIIQTWNKGAEKLYGYSASEVLGKPISILMPPDKLDDFPEFMERLRRGERIDRHETIRRKKNGERVEVSLTLSVLRNGTGEIIGASVIAHDVTELKRQREALRKSEKLAATGRLAASIAHEINNPLEALTNLFFILESDSSLTDTARNYAQAAGLEIRRMAHITKQMLAFHRQSDAPVDIRIPEILDSVLDLYDLKIRQNHITVVKKYEGDTRIEGFPAELRQVFANFVGNAIEALGQQGTVRLHVFASREWNGSARRGVRAVVADNGPGISIAQRRLLFEPFFTTKGERGTGLGLWVSSGIVQKHGGSIRVRSSTRAGRSGTCFSVFLPQRASGEAAGAMRRANA